MDMNKLFEKLDMPNIYDQKVTCNIEQVSRKLYELMETEWKSGLLTKPKLRSYVNFKMSYGVEDYVANYVSRMQRSLLAQLRIGILPLHIETGRFRSVPLDNRLCQLCNMQEIEDEKHFIVNCAAYIDIRNVMYNKVITKNRQFLEKTDTEKCIYLLTHESVFICQYIKDAWFRRREAIYKKN